MIFLKEKVLRSLIVVFECIKLNLNIKIPLQFLILHINERTPFYGPYEMQKYFHYIHNKI